jgi:hypothetical protein
MYFLEQRRHKQMLRSSPHEPTSVNTMQRVGDPSLVIHFQDTFPGRNLLGKIERHRTLCFVKFDRYGLRAIHGHFLNLYPIRMKRKRPLCFGKLKFQRLTPPQRTFLDVGLEFQCVLRRLNPPVQTPSRLTRQAAGAGVSAKDHNHGNRSICIMPLTNCTNYGYNTSRCSLFRSGSRKVP